MEQELCEHIIKIDDYLQVTMKIPKVLDAMTFKGITSKASKLFNLSDVAIDEDVPKRKYNKSGNYKNGHSDNIGTGNAERKKVFTQEMTEYIVLQRKDEIAWQVIVENLNAKFAVNVTQKQVQDKYHNLRLQTPEKFKATLVRDKQNAKGTGN